MKQLLAIIFALAATLCACAIDVADVPNVHVADRTRYVSDPQGYLSAADRAETDRLLGEIWASTSAEPVVVIIDTTGDTDLDDYATELFRLWGIGKKDKSNGVLVLVAVEDREAVIRTGYGAEGLLTDVQSGRIIRHEMAPHFRNGDYGGGVVAAVTAMQQAFSSPEARDELMSSYDNDEGAGGSDVDLFAIYLGFSGVLTAILLIVALAKWRGSRGKSTFERYDSLSRMKLGYITASIAGLGVPLVALAVLLLLMRRIRLRKRLCPNCSTRMHRLDEQTDNLYLTPVQDAEEHLDSVDYDVWLCDNCGETDIIPYINHQKNLKECQQCSARACKLVAERIVRQPTTLHEGVGMRTYRCLNCGKTVDQPYKIAKVDASAAAAGLGAASAFRGGHGGGGGGFSGGSFGGGFTGGGGARGGW